MHGGVTVPGAPHRCPRRDWVQRRRRIEESAGGGSVGCPAISYCAMSPTVRLACGRFPSEIADDALRDCRGIFCSPVGAFHLSSLVAVLHVAELDEYRWVLGRDPAQLDRRGRKRPSDPMYVDSTRSPDSDQGIAHDDRQLHRGSGLGVVQKAGWSSSRGIPRPDGGAPSAWMLTIASGCMALAAAAR